MTRVCTLAGLLVSAFLFVAAGARDEVYRYDQVAGHLLTEPVDVDLAALEERLRDERSSLTQDRIDGWLEERAKGGYVGSFDSAGPWLVWDEYNPTTQSFDVLVKRFGEEGAGEALVLAGGPNFQARPVARLVPDGTLWVAWEEGPKGYGSTYRSIDKLWNNASDDYGPLHSWRAVRLAAIGADGHAADVRVPMPSFAAAALGDGRRAGAKRLGVFYERPTLAVEQSGALVLGLRHMHQYQLALDAPTKTHVERGFAIDVLRLTGSKWSVALRLDEFQRNGNQRLVLAPAEDGLRILAEAGRRDRRTSREDAHALPRVIQATLPSDDVGSPPEARGARTKLQVADERSPLVQEHETVQVGGRAYTLLFGDLHRHTDLSLCFPFYDGSLDDAYRYARGPGALDFVAITDHARDLGRGDAGGWPWQRSLAAANRHHEPGAFVAFYSYERSQSNTDHNVIGLRADILRPHTPPLADFWDEWQDEDILTIPHATGGINGRRFTGDVWQKRDDRMRPLAEVYQSYRDVDSLEELQRAALGTGQKLGLIASSDHLSTSGAYACVWAEGRPSEALDREPIFDALRRRRTYGATARIELEVRSEGAWMGEQFDEDGPFPIAVRVTGTGPIETVTYWVNGEAVHTVAGEGHTSLECSWSWEGPQADELGWCLVAIEQENGDRAWASPFFVN